MTTSGLFIEADDGLTVLHEAPFELEDHLQALIARHPELLAGDDDDAADRRFLLVRREQGISVSETESVGSEEQPPEDGETSDTRAGGGPYRRANEDLDPSPSDPFERDPQELERSLGSHNSLQNELAARVRERGFQPLSPLPLDPEFDVAWRVPDGAFVLVEVKSATPSNLEGQLRIGLGQLLRYGQTLRDRGETVRHILVVERPPADAGWLDLLSRLDVQLITPDILDEASPG